MSESRLRINTPHVIHESIDGEVVVINLETGNYYSMRGSGAGIWELLQSRPAIARSEFVDGIAESYGGAHDEVAAAIGELLDELVSEGLLVGADSSPDDVVPLESQALGVPFERPVLEKYTDMQDLVLLDPVHEVDQQGWPQPRPDSAAA
jgi:Coenzyme PQQ synthesis protein D (PqqD)